MKMFTVLAMFCSILLLPALSHSGEPESSANDGYIVVGETTIAGNYEYNGCVASGPLRFADGRVFVCTTFGHDTRQYMPKVIILQNKAGEYQIQINGKTYSGYFINGQ